MPHPRTFSRLVRVVSAALAAAGLVALTACAPDPVAQDYLSGDGKGYISADSIEGQAIVEFAPDERGEAITFGGVTEHGDDFSSEDALGGVTVVNFWYAGCPPCRAEAGFLQDVWAEYENDNVTFMGVNIYDQPETALSFAKQYGVTYPSLIDVETGQAKLAFARVMPIQAPPTTLVLDAEGRVAARIIGPIDSPVILSTIVKDVLAESA